MGIGFKQPLPLDTPERLSLDAGVLLYDFDPENITTVNGYLDLSKYELVGLTSGGLNITCVPQITDIGDGVDGVNPKTKEFQKITHYECGVSSSLVTGGIKDLMTILNSELTEKTINIGTLKMSKVVAKSGMIPTSMFKDIWIVGPQGENEIWAINLKNAMSTSGYNRQTTDKDKSTFAFELSGYYGIDDPDTCPMEFYYYSSVETPTPPTREPEEDEDEV